MSRGRWAVGSSPVLAAALLMAPASADLHMAAHLPVAAHRPGATVPAGGQHAAPTRTGAADGAGALVVQISSFSPAVPVRGGSLTLQGTVTNTSTAPVTEVAAVLRVSPTTLPSRGEIPEVLAGGGTRVGIAVPGVTDEVAAALAPGESAGFVLRAEVDDLGLDAAGVYVTGVEAVGSTGSGAVRQDLQRTFLPWWPQESTATPLRVTTLWPLTGPPVRDADGVLLSEAPAIEMSPAGRLASLLQAAAEQPGAVSLVIDPEAVESAADMADGYAVRIADSVAPGVRSAEVATWLGQLRSAVAAPGADVVAMLYGQPDVVAARRGRVLGVMLRQRPEVDQVTASVLGEPLPGEVALVAGGAADPPTLETLAGAGVDVVVLSDRSVVLAAPTYFTPSGSVDLATDRGNLNVLVTDSGLSAALAMPMATDVERTAARQRLLAETLVTVTELPETERLLVAAPDAGWSPTLDGARMVVESLATTPWVLPTSLPAALAREPSTLARTLAEYGPEQVAAELTGHVERVRAQYRGLRDYAGILADGTALPGSATRAPTRGMSAWFRADPAEGARLLDVVDGQVRAALGSVRIVSEGSITVSGASGTIPVTVENVGTVPVTVGLVLSSTPPQLFQAEPVEPFRIDPDRRTSVEVTTTVIAAGPVQVSVQLTSAGGDPFGEPGQLTVQSSAYADAARILVRLALAGLLLAVAVHGVRRARRRRRSRLPRTDEGADRRASEVVGG